MLPDVDTSVLQSLPFNTFDVFLFDNKYNVHTHKRAGGSKEKKEKKEIFQVGTNAALYRVAINRLWIKPALPSIKHIGPSQHSNSGNSYSNKKKRWLTYLGSNQFQSDQLVKFFWLTGAGVDQKWTNRPPPPKENR